MCDEMERSIHDAMCVVKRVLESKSVVPGGGAVEAALSIYLENFATSLVSKQPAFFLVYLLKAMKLNVSLCSLVFFFFFFSPPCGKFPLSLCRKERNGVFL